MKKSTQNYIFMFMILTASGLLYDRYKLKTEKDEELEQYNMIQNFLLNDSSLARSNKPIIWIHLEFMKNSRLWSSFYSRTSYELNQPYLHLTIKSIIEKCGESFNICLIDDQSFEKIIPGWTINLDNLASPIKNHIRQLALARMLYYYGGFIVPASFVCFKNLSGLFKDSLNKKDAFVIETVPDNITSSHIDTFPSSKFIGCKKNSPIMKEYFQYLEQLNSSDFTSEADFDGTTSKWLYEKCLNGQMHKVCGSLIGVKDKEGKTIILDDLMSENYLRLSDKCLGIYIPSEQILRRTKYEWFARMSFQQILTCCSIICKHILLSNKVN